MKKAIFVIGLLAVYEIFSIAPLRLWCFKICEFIIAPFVLGSLIIEQFSRGMD